MKNISPYEDFYTYAHRSLSTLLKQQQQKPRNNPNGQMAINRRIHELLYFYTDAYISKTLC